MKNPSKHTLSRLFVPGFLCALTILGLQILPTRSARAVADDADAKKNSSQKDDSNKANAQDSKSNNDKASDNKDARDNSGNQDSRNGKRAWIGIRLQDPDNEPAPNDQTKANQNMRGVEATAIYPSGPAARAGLRAGDRIQSINGKAVASSRQVTDAIANLQPGAQAQIVVNRNGADQTLTVTLGDAAAFNQHQQPMAGNFQQRSYTYGGNPQGSEQTNGYYGQGNGNNQAGANPYDGVPEHAMMLEYNRRNSEQHQRLESQIEELLQEVRSLRKEVQQLKAK